MIKQKHIIYSGRSVATIGFAGLPSKPVCSALEALNSDLAEQNKQGWKFEGVIYSTNPLQTANDSVIVATYTKVDYNTYLNEKLDEIKTKAYTDALNLVKESVGPLQEMALDNLKERIDSLVNAKLEELKLSIK